MLSRIAIRNLGVIEAAEAELGAGFTVITGETGAGKTMLLTGLALLAGGKGDASLVRPGASRAEVDGEWAVQGVAGLSDVLDEAGLEPEGEVLLLARTISAEGRSRAFVDARAVPAPMLGEISRRLVTVHGQSDQLRLRSTSEQRMLLDRFAGDAHLEQLVRYQTAYTRWKRAAAEHAELTAQRDAREREAAVLALGIADIEAVAPLPGEDADLDIQAARLDNAGALLEAVDAAHRHLVGDDDGPGGAMESLARSAQTLERALAMDPSLEPVRERLRELVGIATEVAADLAGYAADVDADPARQQAVQDRRAELGALKRRYGPTLEAVVDWLEDARSQVQAIEGDDGRLERLQQEADGARAEAEGLSLRLSEARRRASEQFAAAVSAELAALAMPDSALVVRLGTGELGPFGADEVEILLKPHRGAEPRPLSRTASGGELSRVMLALEVVMADAGSVGTLVFDEVDAGVGGRAAVEVGRRLARLAKGAQVVVVTHLPQVAAFADAHLVVSKGDAGDSVVSAIRLVSGEDRVSELVRMLSGLEGSKSGADHARELLEAAALDRGGAA